MLALPSSVTTAPTRAVVGAVITATGTLGGELSTAPPSRLISDSWAPMTGPEAPCRGPILRVLESSVPPT